MLLFKRKFYGVTKLIIRPGGQLLNVKRLKRIFTVILLIVILSTSYFTPKLVYCVPEVREATLTIVAVAETPQGSRGVATKLYVKVEEPGSGKIYISADPLAEVDLQASARTAALVSATLTHKDPRSFNVYISIESESFVIGGPSAGAAITVAITSLLLNLKPDPLVVITGMVNPDGTIGPVGGLVEKLEAAAEAGAKYFLVPIGQKVAYRSKVVRESKGPVIVERVVREAVDLEEYGSKLGVIVREVSTIREAIKYFTGYEIPVRGEGEPKLSTVALSTIEDWVEDLLEGYRAGVNDSLRLKREVSPSIAKIVEDFLSQAKTHADKAEELRSEKPYTAASEAFQAAYNSWTAKWILEAYLAEDIREYIQMRVEEVNTTISLVESEVENIISSGRGLLDAIVGAKIRLKLAEDALKSAIQSFESREYVDALFNLAYAKWRARTAQTWAKASKLLNVKLPDKSLLREISTTYYYEAESVTGYAEALISESTSSIPTLSEALNYVSEAKKSLDKEDYIASISYSLEAIAYSTISIHYAFAINPEKLIPAIRGETLNSIREVKSLGGEAILALSYLEYADNYRESGSLGNAIVFYELAASYSNLLILSNIIAGRELEVTPIHPTTTEPSRNETRTVTTSVKEYSKNSIEKFLEEYALEILLVVAAVLTLGTVISILKRPGWDEYW